MRRFISFFILEVVVSDAVVAYRMYESCICMTQSASVLPSLLPSLLNWYGERDGMDIDLSIHCSEKKVLEE